MELSPPTRRGYLLLADVSGYTAFLTQSELDHAQDILRSLFETLMAHVPAPFTVVEVEGDALFAHAPDGALLRGETLLEVVEDAYCAFVETRERMRRNTTCTCTACRLIPELDLKFAVHHGEYLLQQALRKHAPKPSGPDVILVHRLLKNTVREATGVDAYAFLTEAVVRVGGLGPVAEGMAPHAERYEHLGEVRGVVHDLGAVWARERERRRVLVRPEETWFTIETVLPAPLPEAWVALNDPDLKQRWREADAVTATGGPRGRTGVGTTHHCAHGKMLITEEIVDWRPFDYVTTDQGWPMGARSLGTDRLEPLGAGTRLRCHVGRPRGKNALHEALVVRPVYALLRGKLEADMRKSLDNLRRLLEQARAGGPPPAPPAPDPAFAPLATSSTP
jgi:uncharacterized protein YndB with AHSA1/START domain